MNRTRLVRTPIVDKNGKLTTVHKRGDEGDTTSAKVFPEPAIKPKRDPAVAAVEDAFEPCVDRLPPAEKQKLMETLHPDTLPKLIDMKRKHPNMVMFHLNIAMDWSVDNRNFALLNSLVLLTHATDERDSEWHRSALHTLNGIHYVTDNDDTLIDFTKDDDPRVEGAIVLFDTIMKNNRDDFMINEHSASHYQMARTFYDPDVGILIMKRPDRADDIVDLYRERKEYDPELFASVLGNSAPAVNEGIL